MFMFAALVAEKHAIEEKLKQELESEREKDKKLAEELLHQKDKLEKVTITRCTNRLSTLQHNTCIGMSTLTKTLKFGDK